MKKNFPIQCVFLSVLLAASGCLKTRAQLREDNTNPDDSTNRSAQANGATAPQPGRIVDAQPQGAYAMDELRSELTQLQGRVEDVERARKDADEKAQKEQSGPAAQAQKDQSQKFEARLAALELAQEKILTQLQKMQESQTAAATMSPEDALGAGKVAMESANYDAAIESFSTALKTAKGKTAEDATFLRAEAYFQQKQYKKAIIDFSKFPEKYTQSKYMSRALYRIGQSFDALGMKDDAKGFYQELVDKHPKSKEAKMVRAKLRN
ncbi:MAG: tetratricopeptide repeat protein [Oligoflexia bacterium]|nr:tetratricopeptide repeat protein [Oligoflexia bacterium]